MPFDFSKNATVDSLDQVPADFQPFYKEGEDGTFALDSENPVVKSSVAVIAGLNKSLSAARKEAKDAKGKQIDLSPLSDYGTSIEEIVEGIQAKIAEVQTEGGKKSEADVQKKIDAIKADLLKANEQAVQTRDARIEALTGQLYKRMVEAEASAALAPVAVDVELALPFVKNQIKVAEADGQFVVQVVDGEGNERHGGTGNPMTIKELVAEMKGNPKYAPLFKSDSNPGAGTPPGSTNRRTNAQTKTEDLSPTDKIKSGLDKGQFKRGRAEAARTA